jgi:hypothetical protein
MNTKTNTPRFFVTYHFADEFPMAGEWIDGSEDSKTIEEYVYGELNNFPQNSFISVSDYDNFCGAEDWLVDRYSLETVVEVAHFILAKGEIGAKWIDCLDGDVHKALETFDDSYAGCYADLKDFVKEINADKEIPGWIGDYIKWEKMGKDLILNKQIYVVETDSSKVHVFLNRDLSRCAIAD